MTAQRLTMTIAGPIHFIIFWLSAIFKVNLTFQP